MSLDLEPSGVRASIGLEIASQLSFFRWIARHHVQEFRGHQRVAAGRGGPGDPPWVPRPRQHADWGEGSEAAQQGRALGKHTDGRRRSEVSAHPLPCVPFRGADQLALSVAAAGHDPAAFDVLV